MSVKKLKKKLEGVLKDRDMDPAKQKKKIKDLREKIKKARKNAK